MKNERKLGGLNEREKGVINTLLLALYAGDTHSLKDDIAEVMRLGTTKDAPTNCRALFRWLCEELSLHTKEDFNDILAECDRIEAS